MRLQLAGAAGPPPPRRLRLCAGVEAWDSRRPRRQRLLRELVLRRLHPGRIGEEIEGGERPWSWHAATMPCARQRLHRRVGELAGVNGRARSGRWPTIGWMVGMTWLTLPTSEEPSRSGIGGPSARPAVAMLAREEVEQHAGCDFRGSYTLSVPGVTFTRGAGGPGRALRARDHALEEVPHRVDARGAHVEDRRPRTPG